jgi:hypothetical protein
MQELGHRQFVEGIRLRIAGSPEFLEITICSVKCGGLAGSCGPKSASVG